jgi:hypothetical protein
MSLSPDILRKLATLKLSALAMAGVLEILADLQGQIDDRRGKDRARKQKSRGKSEECHVTVTGNGRDSHSDKKEIPPTPPKEKTTTSSEANASSSAGRPKRVRAGYSDDFEAFWKAYPTTPVMSKAEAGKVWPKLSEPDRQAASAAVPRYVAWLSSKPGHPAVHAVRFITQRRWVGFGEPEATATDDLSGKAYVMQGTPRFDAWDAYKRQQTGRGLIVGSRGGALVDSDWPPGYEPPSAALDAPAINSRPM